jgi:hypothetical protein
MNMVRKAMGIGVVATLAALMVVSMATAQPGGGGGAGGPGGGGGFGGGMGGGGFDPAQMQQMMDQRNMETLGATEAQWKTIGPKFNAVQTINRSLSAGGGMGGRGGMGRMGGMGGMGGGMPGAQQTEMDKARESLNTTLDNASATPQQIQAAVKAFRDARDKAKKDLVTAQADLKKAIGDNAKMEARLVGMGMLD